MKEIKYSALKVAEVAKQEKSRAEEAEKAVGVLQKSL